MSVVSCRTATPYMNTACSSTYIMEIGLPIKLDVVYDTLPFGLQIYHVKCIFGTPANDMIEALETTMAPGLVG